MKYYERGSLSDISNRAELVKKFFSQNVWNNFFFFNILIIRQFVELLLNLPMLLIICITIKNFIEV
jgi:hypothetical protein